MDYTNDNESVNNESMNNESMNNESMNNLQQKILDTNIELLNLQKSRPNIGKYFLYFLLIVVIYLVITILRIMLAYKPIFNWWKNNNGQQYDKFVSIFSIMASHDSIIIYWLVSLFGNIFTTLNRQQIMFFSDIVLPYSVIINSKGVKSGFVVPRHVARDIRFSREDGIVEYNNWLDDDSIPDIDKIYPNALERDEWKNKFIKWGVGGWALNDDQFYVPNYTIKKPEEVVKEWFDIKKHPDNFLARYGMFVDCPLILGFVNNLYSIDGIELNPSCMEYLLGGGSPGNPGGWVGWMISLGDDISRTKYNDFLYSKLNVKDFHEQPKNNDPGCEPWSLITEGLAGGAGLGSVAAFLVPATGPFAPLFIAGTLGLVAVGAGPSIYKGIKCATSD
jgi:hypothetical protein